MSLGSMDKNSIPALTLNGVVSLACCTHLTLPLAEIGYSFLEGRMSIFRTSPFLIIRERESRMPPLDMSSAMLRPSNDAKPYV